MTIRDLRHKNHCANIGADRKLGKKWELNFCQLVATYCRGGMTPHQILQSGNVAAGWWGYEDQWKLLLLPDVTLWRAPGEHHEIKHKNPTPEPYRCYGLEEYRLEALYKFAVETGQRVLYTIHDWELAGASSSRDQMRNRLSDWVTADICSLYEKATSPSACFTYRNGSAKLEPTHFWPIELWTPLSNWWGGLKPRHSIQAKIPITD